MKKMSTFNFKKMISIIAIFFSMMVGFVFASCADKNYEASFKKSEYIVSIGETVDIAEDIQLKNITLSDLSFYSSDTNLLRIENVDSFSEKNRTVFTALDSGFVTIYIYYRGEALDTAQVTIKNSFMTPTNIEVSNDGMVTWDVVSIQDKNGNLVNAEYSIMISSDGIEYESFETPTNSYQLTAQGRYFIKVKALASSFADESEWSEPVERYYNTAHMVEGLSFSNLSNEKGYVTWLGSENADYYIIKIDEVESTEKIFAFNKEVDLSMIEAGEVVSISIKACSSSDEISDSPYRTISVKKLGLGEIENDNGKLMWHAIEGAVSYNVNYVLVSDSTVYGTLNTRNTYSNLTGLSEGVYEVSIQAVSAPNIINGMYYANSEEVAFGQVAKLGLPDFEYNLNEGKLNLKISTLNENIKKFDVRIFEKATRNQITKAEVITGDSVGGVYSVSDSIVLPAQGVYDVFVTTLIDGIEQIELDGVSCESILSSDEGFEITIASLPVLENVTHRYDSDENSIISFSRPSYEMNYSIPLDFSGVSINGRPVVATKSYDIVTQKYSLNLGKITKEFIDGNLSNNYVISITVDASTLPSSTAILGTDKITQECTKTLTMLSVDTMELNGNELSENYTYSSEHSNYFEYNIYETDNTFIVDEYTRDNSVIDSYGRITKPSAGYYAVYIIAYPSDQNLYLMGEAFDSFYVTQSLQSTELDFGKTSVKMEDGTTEIDELLLSGYYVEISAVDGATQYDVYLNDSYLSSVIDGDFDGKAYYYFTASQTFSSGTYQVKVVARGTDDYIYLQSVSQITVERLTAPNVVNLSGQSLVLSSTNNLHFFKNAISGASELSPTIETSGSLTNYTVNLENIYGTFSVLVYATKNSVENDIYYLDSSVATYNVRKVGTPTELNFKDDEVSFLYTDEYAQADREHIEIVSNVIVESASSEYEEFEYVLPLSMVTIDISGKISFVLEDLISALKTRYPNFENMYAQKDSIRLQIFIRTSYYNSVRSEYVLSSQKATSATNVNLNYISIEKLQSVTLYFNESQKMIYWQGTENQDFEIILNDVVTAQSASYNSQNSRYELDLSSKFDAKSSQGNFFNYKVKKIASNYLSSNYSNEISLYFLRDVSSINVNTDIDNHSFVVFTYSDNNIDQSKISVNVNRSSQIEVFADQTKTSYQFDLNTAITSYVINVVGYYENDSVENKTTYYISSSSSTFSLIAFDDVANVETITIANSNISWTNYGNSFDYIVYFDRTSTRDAKLSIGTNSLSLSNSVLEQLQTSDYDVSIFAVYKNFEMNSGSERYYGGAIIAEGTVYKLQGTNNISLNIDESSSTITGEKAVVPVLAWVWNESHTQGANISFQIKLNGTTLTSIAYVEGNSNYSYNIPQASFGDLNNTISVRVLSDKDVASNVKDVVIYKFTPASVTVSDDRILNISYSTTNSSVVASNGYIVKVTVDGNVTEFATTDATININSIIGNHFGNYSVDVLIKNVTNVAICPANVTSVSGTVLAKPTITQNENGIVVSSTEENVSYLLSIKKDGEYIVRNQAITGVYNFTDSYVGNYTIEAISVSAGKLNSAIETQNITVNRLSEVQNITLTRSRTFNQGQTTDYMFTWDSVLGAESYECIVYNNSSAVLQRENVVTNSFSINEEDITALGGSGNYYLGIRALGNITNGNSNSIEKRVSLQVETQVNAIALTDDGQIKITGRGDLLLYLYNGMDEINIILRQSEATSSGSNYIYTYFVENLAGQIHICVTTIANELGMQENASVYKIDSLAKTASYDKLKTVSSVALNIEDGKIYINLAESLASGTSFNFKTNNNSHKITPETFGESEYAFNFIDIFDELDVNGNGEKAIELYLTKTGNLRSESYEFSFDYTQTVSSDYTQNRGIDLLHDYILVHKKSGKDVKLILVTIKTRTTTQKFVLNASDYLGYWHITDSGAYFSPVYDDSAISNEEVYAILINDIITRAGTSTISLCYIYETDGHMFGINDWSSELTYEKLPAVFNVYASDGVISWSLSSSSNYESVTGYYVIFEDRNGDTQNIYIPSYETKRVTTEELISANKTFKVSVVAVSTIGTNKIASSGVYFKHSNGNVFNVIKAKETTSVVEINDGVLSIDLSRPNIDSAYGKLYGESLAQGTILSNVEDNAYYMPYGLGRKSSDDEVNEGTGTFTAVVYKNQIMYIRTEFIDGTYTLTQDAKLYSDYNVSIDDVLKNWNAKYATSQLCVETFATKLFTYPFTFSIESLITSQNMFEMIFKNSATMAETKIIVDGVELVQKTEYVSALTNLLNGISDSVPGKQIVSDFLDMMKDEVSFTGLATDNLLFDNIGKKYGGFSGESIEPGDYDIYLTQIGFEIPNTQVGNETYILTSPKTKIFDSCKVISSPVVKTYRTSNADGYSYNYFLKFAPNYIDGVMLKDYRLVMSYDEDSTMAYDIKYESGVWYFYKTTTTRFALSTHNDGGVDYVLIPLNNANGLNIILDSSYSYVANIYSVGTSTRLCSKTEPINVKFLGFNSAIKLTMKGFEWFSYSDGVNSYPTTVVYKRASETNARITTVRASTGVSRFNPAFNGLYNYMMFIAQGNIATYSVVVDSAIYRVENVFKLYSPIISVNWEGEFAIQNSVNNPNEYLTPTYKITNIVSVDIGARRPDDDELFATTTSSTYKAGAIDVATGSYKETELSASEYYFVTVGDEYESFAVRVFNDGEYYLLDYGQSMLFMSSEKTDISAAILENPTPIFVNDNGDIEWNSVDCSPIDDLQATFVDGETVIVYKVIVEYYHETFEGMTKDEQIDTYFTKSNILPASYIEGNDETIDYTYKVTIYAFPAYDDASLNGILTSLNNDLKKTNVYFSDNEHFILANAGASHTFKRLNDVENISIADGYITWESEYSNLNLYKFVVQYNGPTMSGELLGEYSYDSATDKFTFALDDENQILSSELSYTVSVFVSPKYSSQNMLTSFEKKSGTFRILPSIESEHIQKTSTEVDGVKNDEFDIISFFNQYKNGDSTRYSKVLVTFKTYNITTGTLIGVNSSSFELYYNSEFSYKSKFVIVHSSGTYDGVNDPYKLYLASGYRIELELQVVAIGGNYINSYKYGFELAKNNWTSLDQIVYDNSLDRFVWTFGKKLDGSEYEGDIYFRVAITYQKRTLRPNTRYDEINYTRTYDNIRDKFFVPELAGFRVSEFKIQARIGLNNVDSDWLIYSGEDITFNLFSSGFGSQDNPYIISSAQEFANINILGNKPEALLNGYHLLTVQREVDAQGQPTGSSTIIPAEISIVDQIYYFMLANDISLETNGNFIILNSFGSNFDGDGHTITFTARSGVNPGESLSGRVAQGEEASMDIEFNQVGSIFKKVAVGGKVENAKLSVDFTYSPYGGGVKTDTLFAGLVLVNDGTVENIDVVKYKVTMNEEISNTFTLAGIVGINHSTVKLCTMSARVNIENTYSTGQSLFVSGIVGFNEGQNANITVCQVASTSAIRASLSNSQNGLVQCAGITLSNVNGVLSLCGNSGIITAICDNGQAYSSGIVIYSNGGRIVDSFNSNNVNGKSDYSAGIVYSCNSTIGNIFGFGKVNSATESPYIIAKRFSGETSGTCYASRAYDNVVRTTALTGGAEFTTSNSNYRIRVTYSSGNFSVSFV